MALPTAILLLAAVAVSGYAFFEYARATQRLRIYEKKGEKAAKWSSSVERIMMETRVAIAFGLVASALSFLSGFNFLFRILVPPSDSWVPYHAVWAALVAASLHYSSEHMRSFWRGKPKVPTMGDWNAAIDESKDVLQLLGALRGVWLMIAGLKLVGL